MAQTPATRHTASSVRAEAARAGLTVRGLALALGWSSSRLSRRMSGETEFTVSELTAIAAHLDVPLSALLPPDPVLADTG